MLHATRYAIRSWSLEADALMVVGAARDGHLLEIGIDKTDEDDPVIFHAMQCTPKYNPYL